MAFLRNLLAAILGTLIAFGLIFLFFIVIGALAGASDKQVLIKENSVLEISFDKPIKDYGGKYRFTDFNYQFEQFDGLNNIINAIDRAASDPKIKGISLESNMVMAGSASLKSIRDALERFRSSGKFVYAYGDLMLQKDYYLASVSDSVFLNPAGELDFRGLSSEVLFLKGLQDKSGVHMEVIRHGKYKSAVEPYLSDTMSEENRLQITELLESIWSVYRADISRNRNIAGPVLDEYANTLAARSPRKALENGFVDQLWYRDQYETFLKERTGTPSDKDLHRIGVEAYAEHLGFESIGADKDRIAVVYAQGEIGYGKGDDRFIGQGIMSEALREAREDDRVKAVVLRINSPGGVALTSDLIWREIEITKSVKPVIVSMGDLAASGGYYMAMAGDYIFAEPSTITGSIGVFATIPNLSDLANRWGINAEQVNTHRYATPYSLFEPATEDFRTVAKEQIEEFYQDFISKVAQARGKSVAEIDSVAQGRVWTGNQALANGLVDEIGGLDQALEYAAKKAGLTDYKVRNYPVYETSFEDLLDQTGLGFFQQKEDLLREELGDEIYRVYQQLRMNRERAGLQARMPFDISIQ